MTPNPAAAVREIVHLGTHSVVGWTVEAMPEAGGRGSVAAFRWALGAAVAQVSVGPAQRRTSAVVPVPDDDEVIAEIADGLADLADSAPAHLRHRLVLEFDGRALEADAAIDAARRATELGLRLGVRLDASLAGLSALSTGLPFAIARFGSIAPPDTLHGRLAADLARRLRREGLEVVVDGIDTDDAAERWRRHGVPLGQGPRFDGVERLRTTAYRLEHRSYPMPAHEDDRMRLVLASAILDSAHEAHFDLAVEQAAIRCSTPISLLTIVDSHRQWFKAAVGLDVTETPREWAFCAHTVCGSGELAVPDALADVRFRRNPLVVGSPHIRAYLGVPLLATSGLAFGSLCVIDTIARDFDDDEVQHVRSLARLVSDSIELRAVIALAS